MPAQQWFATLTQRLSPPPLRTLLRAATDRVLPPKQLRFSPSVVRRQRRLLSQGRARPDQINPIFREERPGQIPTIVVGGFVPGPADATYLQRALFLKYGSTYHLHYSSQGFSTELLEAQLSDLVEELATHHGTPPVVFAISFGGGLVVQWLRKLSEAGRSPQLSGLVLVSPVACTADLLEPGVAKATTLLGRVMKGFLDMPGDVEPAKAEAWVERSRQVMVKMFESGVQNKEALRQVLTRREVLAVRANVMESMRLTNATGAKERTCALHTMPSPAEFTTEALPLCEAPALVLYAEKESSIMVDSAPTRRVFETQLERYFPEGSFAMVSNPGGSPVQHASLLFHCFNFEPHLQRFYRRLRHELPGNRRIQHTLTRIIKPAHIAQRRRAEAAARAAACSGEELVGT